MTRRADVEKLLPAGDQYRLYRHSLFDEVEPNGLTVASTFSGVGGSSMGYRLAGYRVVYANEFADRAAEAYRLNRSSKTYLDRRDVREITGASIVEIAGGVPDVLDGSPPCSPFSMIGKGVKHWGQQRHYTSGQAQRTDDLLDEYARLVEEIRPPVFLMENVNSIAFGTNQGHYNRLVSRLSDAEYRVVGTVIDSSLLGTPTARRRMMIVGTDQRRALPPPPEIEPSTITPTPFSTVTGSRWWISRRPQKGYRRRRVERLATERPLPTVTTVGISDVPFHYVVTIDRHPIDSDGWKLAPATPHLHQALSGYAIEPEVVRQIGLIDIVPASGFPIDVKLTGPHTDQWERIGRAVPPTAMARVAAEIVDQVFAA